MKISVGQSLTLNERPSGRPLPSAILMCRTAGWLASAAAVALTADPGTPTGKYTLVGVAGAATQTLNFDVSSVDFVVPTWVFP